MSHLNVWFHSQRLLGKSDSNLQEFLVSQSWWRLQKDAEVLQNYWKHSACWSWTPYPLYSHFSRSSAHIYSFGCYHNTKSWNFGSSTALLLWNFLSKLCSLEKLDCILFRFGKKSDQKSAETLNQDTWWRNVLCWRGLWLRRSWSLGMRWWGIRCRFGELGRFEVQLEQIFSFYFVKNWKDFEIFNSNFPPVWILGLRRGFKTKQLGFLIRIENQFLRMLLCLKVDMY